MSKPEKMQRGTIENRDSVMSAPHVFFVMFCLLLVFAIVTYGVSGSIVVTAIRTVISAMCLQVGYGAVVVYLVRRQVRERKSKLTKSRNSDEAPVSSRKKTDL
jgi:xanthine/uracil/vitamin C permease (AzgA family)